MDAKAAHSSETFGLIEIKKDCSQSPLPPTDLGTVGFNDCHEVGIPCTQKCGERAYGWWEKNILVGQGSSMPMYWYVEEEDARSKPRVARCYMVRTDMITDPNMKACVRSRSGRVDDVNLLTVTATLSKSPSFTCYDHDRCREECREALTEDMTLQETNTLLANWISAIMREQNGGPNRGLNEDTILQNFVEPDSTYNVFPRSTHILYPREFISTSASDGGTRQLPNTFWMKASVNMTMYEALRKIGMISDSGQISQLVAETNEEIMNCPDGTWCDATADSSGQMSVRRFCAQPFICPVRTHHSRYSTYKSQARDRNGHRLIALNLGLFCATFVAFWM